MAKRGTVLRGGGGGATAAVLKDEGNGRFALQGELSFATVPALLRQSGPLFASHAAIELDLADVRRADSAGLALLVEWLATARRQGKRLSFRHVPDQLLSIARVSGLERILSL